MDTEKPTNRFAEWAEESKNIEKEFSQGKKFARHEMRDLKQRAKKGKPEVK